MEYYKSHSMTPPPTTLDMGMRWGEFVPGDPPAVYGPDSVLYDGSTNANVPDPSAPLTITVESFNLAASTATVRIEY
jgi:hypothetical protein